MLCAVIADDLTGACDSAVQFANVGLRAVAALSAMPDAEVLAVSTNSRDLAPADAVCRVRKLGGAIRAQILFKKIDSTLRGNTAVEVVAALDAFGCDVALLNPAFPEMGRIVENGRLHVTGDPSFRPIDLRATLRAAGAEEGRFEIFDALTQADLARAVSGALASKHRVLWVGSAGMASALAELLGNGRPRELGAHRRGPVLFCIGSDHPVTVEQIRRLMNCRSAVALDRAEDVGTALDRQHVVLRVARDRVGDLSGARPSALVLSGGDTASLVCGSLGAHSIDLRRELARGVPAGILVGGALDGTPVITKSGGFGAPDDLLRIADYFNE